MTDQVHSLVPAAKLLGLASAAGLSGYIAGFSIYGIPAVQMAPVNLMAKQWSRIYNIGKNSVPPMALISSTCFAFLAYQSRNIVGRFDTHSWIRVSPFRLYVAAAVLAPSIMPYTFGVMWGGVRALEQKAAGEIGAPSDTETETLLEEWGAQNLVRATIVGTAALLCALATFT